MIWSVSMFSMFSGLAVVDESVGTLGGKFAIAATLGQGTTVTVTLPVYHPGQEHLHDKI